MTRSPARTGDVHLVWLRRKRRVIEVQRPGQRLAVGIADPIAKGMVMPMRTRQYAQTTVRRGGVGEVVHEEHLLRGHVEGARIPPCKPVVVPEEARAVRRLADDVAVRERGGREPHRRQPLERFWPGDEFRENGVGHDADHRSLRAATGKLLGGPVYAQRVGRRAEPRQQRFAQNAFEDRVAGLDEFGVIPRRWCRVTSATAAHRHCRSHARGTGRRCLW